MKRYRLIVLAGALASLLALGAVYMPSSSLATATNEHPIGSNPAGLGASVTTNTRGSAGGSSVATPSGSSLQARGTVGLAGARGSVSASSQVRKIVEVTSSPNPETTPGFIEGVDDAVPSELPMIHDVSGTFPLTLRIYTGCWGHSKPVQRKAASWAYNSMASQIEFWNAHGVPMVVSLSYDPPITTEPPNPSQEAIPTSSWPKLYASCAADFARRFGSLPQLKAIDVTNEPDIPNESTSDGAMPLVQLAVVDGVEAAHDALPAGSKTEVGFSWAYATGPYDLALFSTWGAVGGARFASDVDFVDMHIYPGTFAPEDPPAGIYPCGYLGKPAIADLRSLPSITCLRLQHVPAAELNPTSPDGYYYSSYASVTYAVAYLRGVLMPRANLGRRVSILIGETGYRSSGPGSTPDEQVPFFDPGNNYDQLEHLYGEWTAAWDLRAEPFNVAGFIWYELADHYLPPSSSSTSYGSCSLPQPYSGILTNCVTGFGLFAEPAYGKYVARPVLCAYHSIIADPLAANTQALADISKFNTSCPVTFSTPNPEAPYNG
ncbi:MAG: hypothetical protein M1115_09300 [Actinobacteria bacterium]|nr:hypothetical protein [Actinomycetota bacterium]